VVFLWVTLYTLAMQSPEKPWLDPNAESKIPAWKRKQEGKNYLVEKKVPESNPAQAPERVQNLPPLEAEFHEVTAEYPNLRVLMLDSVKQAVEAGTTGTVSEQIACIKKNPAAIAYLNTLLDPSLSVEDALSRAREYNQALEPKPHHQGKSKRLFTHIIGTPARRVILAVSPNGRVDLEVSRHVEGEVVEQQSLPNTVTSVSPQPEVVVEQVEVKEAPTTWMTTDENEKLPAYLRKKRWFGGDK